MVVAMSLLHRPCPWQAGASDHGTRVRDSPAGRQKIAAEVRKLRAWCRLNGVPWRATKPRSLSISTP